MFLPGFNKSSPRVLRFRRLAGLGVGSYSNRSHIHSHGISKTPLRISEHTTGPVAVTKGVREN